MTKKNLLAIYNNYCTTAMKSLRDCYAKPSTAKVSAYNRCQRDMMSNNGGNGSVISYNTFMFTYGYTYDVFKEGVRNRHFVYITPNHYYDLVVA